MNEDRARTNRIHLMKEAISEPVTGAGSGQAHPHRVWRDRRIEELLHDGLELRVRAQHVVEAEANWQFGRGAVLEWLHHHVIRLDDQNVLLGDPIAEVLALDELQSREIASHCGNQGRSRKCSPSTNCQ